VVAVSIAELDARNVSDVVVLAAYDTLAAHVAPLDAVAILSTLGASPAALVATIERRLPHWAVYAYEVAISSHDLLKQGITEAAWVHVVTSGPTEHEAALTAAQMAACHGMPTFLGCEY
jgi:hypothetical protein